MIRPTLKGQRLAALFLLGFLLFNYPLLSLFGGNTRIWGIPLIYLYIFVAWAVVIALMALVIEGKEH